MRSENTCMPLFPLTAAHVHVRRIHAYEEEDTCHMRRRIHLI
jgi:hypothetical protein